MYSRNDGNINKTDLMALCPAVLYQMTKQQCHAEEKKVVDDEEDTGKENPTRAWGYGFLFVTIISLGSLIGAFVVPLMDKPFYKKTLMCMVSLAVGVLGGSGVFHLIPSALGFPFDDDDHSYLWKCCMVFLGLYIFFVLECTMKLYIRFKEMDKKERATLAMVASDEKPATNGGEVHSIGIADSHTHNGHGHSHNGGPTFPIVVVKNNATIDSKTELTSENSRTDLTNENASTEQINVSEKHSEKRAIATVAWMIIIGDGLHNFIDGLAIGASFSGSVVIGISTSLAVICEELPHELGDFAILLNSGLTYKQAMLANFLSACSCYVGLAIGLVLGYATHAVKYIYGIAGGMFLYISLVDMLPEALEMAYLLSGNSKSKSIKMLCMVNLAIIFGFCVMLVIALYGTSIEL
ncbi:zinc transporter ZIP14-like [Paramuricea clavata]|nr:zinc transporter ZIP14-like [Paramuricea clavata]